jgi:hypothetical protein
MKFRPGIHVMIYLTHHIIGIGMGEEISKVGEFMT